MAEDWVLWVSIGADLSLIFSLFAFFWQIVRMYKATTGEVFLTITERLQSKENRKARQDLIHLTKPLFQDWTAEDQNLGETVCALYDTIGILIRRRIIARKLIVQEWAQSIITCWKHATPLINHYRSIRTENTWDDFQWLCEKAKKIKVVPRICPNCNDPKFAPSDNFCSKCGKSRQDLENLRKKNAINMIAKNKNSCKNCGENKIIGNEFCPNCGIKG